MLKHGQITSDILNASHTSSVNNSAITGQINRTLDRVIHSEVLSIPATGKLRVPQTHRQSL